METNAPARILIIDDEKQILNMLAQALGRKGVLVDTARSGQRGLEKIHAFPYDLVITDIKMPGISGEEVLAGIRRCHGSEVPVIGMSGTPWLLDGPLFDAVIEKPCSHRELFAIIDRILRGGAGIVRS